MLNEQVSTIIPIKIIIRPKITREFRALAHFEELFMLSAMYLAEKKLENNQDQGERYSSQNQLAIFSLFIARGLYRDLVLPKSNLLIYVEIFGAVCTLLKENSKYGLRFLSLMNRSLFNSTPMGKKKIFSLTGISTTKNDEIKISYLPDEILLQIISSLELKDVLALRVVSHQFHTLLRDDSVWKPFFEELFSAPELLSHIERGHWEKEFFLAGGMNQFFKSKCWKADIQFLVIGDATVNDFYLEWRKKSCGAPTFSAESFNEYGRDLIKGSKEIFSSIENATIAKYHKNGKPNIYPKVINIEKNSLYIYNTSIIFCVFINLSDSSFLQQACDLLSLLDKKKNESKLTDRYVSTYLLGFYDSQCLIPTPISTREEALKKLIAGKEIEFTSIDLSAPIKIQDFFTIAMMKNLKQRYKINEEDEDLSLHNSAINRT